MRNGSQGRGSQAEWNVIKRKCCMSAHICRPVQWQNPLRPERCCRKSGNSFSLGWWENVAREMDVIVNNALPSVTMHSIISSVPSKSIVLWLKTFDILRRMLVVGYTRGGRDRTTEIVSWPSLCLCNLCKSCSLSLGLEWMHTYRICGCFECLSLMNSLSCVHTCIVFRETHRYMPKGR